MAFCRDLLRDRDPAALREAPICLQPSFGTPDGLARKHAACPPGGPGDHPYTPPPDGQERSLKAGHRRNVREPADPPRAAVAGELLRRLVIASFPDQIGASAA